MYTPAITPHCSFVLKPLAAAVLVVCASGVHAAPSFNGSPGGNVTVETSGSTTTVTQSVTASNRALANWDDFSIAGNESVVFEQPNSNSVILNRVLGSNPSEIFGRLSANGRVFLINPNGIVFGANSEVNVSGLVASTLTLKPGSQNNSDLIEFELTDSGGTITSNGTINAKDIAFLSTDIENNGILNASGAGAAVHLIAASEVTANTSGNDLVLNVLAGHENAVINQLGGVFAQGGKIVLIAQSQTGGQASVINTANIARASQIVIEGDVVRLTGDINLSDVESRLQVTAQTIQQDDLLRAGGAVALQADTVNLDDAGNDFTGTVSLDVNNQATLQDVNALVVQGNFGAATFSAVDLSMGSLNADSLAVNAQTVTQTGALEVGGTTQLNAEAVTLTNASNRFQGTVNATVGNQLSLRTDQDLAVSGNVGNATLQAENIALNGLQATGDVVLSASGSITQGGDVSNALAIGGATQIENASVVRLDNSLNDFEGAVSLNGTGTVALADQNNLVVQGTAGDLTLRASTGPAGQVTLGQLNAESLNVSANRIGQSGAVAVENSATLTAGQLELLNAGNDFQGQVNLSVSGQTSLLDSNQVQVAGTVNSAEIQASEVTINGLTAAGNLTLQGGSINQSGALSVAGSTTLVGGEVNLDNSGNNFNGVVNVNSTGTARIDVAGDLELLGSAQSLTAFSTATLRVSSLDSGNIELTANQIELQNFAARGDLKLNGGSVSQQGALTVEGNTRLGARTVNLQNSGNDFKGVVDLDSAGNVSLRDANGLRLQGRASSVNAQAAGSIDQSAALNIADASEFAATTIALNSAGNTFGGDVALNATDAANLSAQGNLTVGGQAKSLTASASETLRFAATQTETLVASGRQVNQAGILRVSSSTTVSGGSVNLNNAENDFGGSLALNVSGNVTVRDANDLLLTGRAETVNVQVGNTLTLGGVQVESGNFSADTIALNRLNVQDSARLQASVITQTEAAEASGRLNLVANTVSLTDTGNDFSGELRVNSATAHIVDSNDLTMTFAGDNLTAQAANLNVNEMRATGDVLVTADNATIVSSGDLSLQGQVGTLNVQARNLSQRDALRVRGAARLSAENVALRHQANDFQGEVVLNVAGNAVLNDQDSLEISGRVQGAAQFSAESLGQSNALVTESDLLLQASQINLSNEANSLGGASGNPSSGLSGHAVQLEGVTQAVLTSQGNLKIQGAVDSLTIAAQTVELGPLGSLQDLNVVANGVRQSAALRVEGQSDFTANQIELRNTSNDFVGLVNIQARDADLSRVALADSNSLVVQGKNMQFAAQVQGDLNLQADNLLLSNTVVQGSTTVNVEGELTQNQSIAVNNATLTADKITLNHSDNRFDGLTQVQSDKLIELGSASDLNLDAMGSTGVLALNVQGGAAVTGGNVMFANSVFNKDLNVTANDVSQTGRLMVQGDAQVNATGGSVNLQNVNNQFAQTVSVNADRTNVSAQGDLRIKDLVTRGGAITADGRLILQGQIEQTGGTLSFTANGIPRPLSSAEIALMLPPELDVFSAKEAVDPLTGLGRITLASAAIQQVSGQIVTSVDSTTQFKATQNGSVVLAPVNQGSVNQLNGQFEALAGQNHGQAFVYQQEQGASLFAVNNDVQLRVAGKGVESDVVAIRSRGLATVGGESQLRARMPYNDSGAGTSRSYAGLTLSIPLSNPQQGSTSIASFGESSGVGQQAASVGAIRVEVGELNQVGLGGFVTILPFEGSNLLPGQVVYLAGPERRGTYAFFYDGARNLNRIPVVYNGALLLSPQENAALTTAQGAVVLARQEQTRSVVRTENVAGKIINGVVAEVGPGRPATEGEGGAGKPDSCDAAGDGLTCKL
ncbi:MAG: filamentous hemagglutinin N-terminal domain-containing protein [Limnobacter sp.]|uniref:beta strand repeat-containing protein n=1 Tax=Limnobacter sp. TaxID=2003368 RepID=UPI0022CA4182|nr:filamentous hemagglutinin N-terminal domain-containing protein [Limnobacter sp.]MCZ8016035.1 filamentous hemagglutinin N-terminal domain-containing protein [Limnobacter sp.]